MCIVLIAGNVVETALRRTSDMALRTAYMHRQSAPKCQLSASCACAEYRQSWADVTSTAHRQSAPKRQLRASCAYAKHHQSRADVTSTAHRQSAPICKPGNVKACRIVNRASRTSAHRQPCQSAAMRRGYVPRNELLAFASRLRGDKTKRVQHRQCAKHGV